MIKEPRRSVRDSWDGRLTMPGKVRTWQVRANLALLTADSPSAEASRFSGPATDHRHGNSARISSADYRGRILARPANGMGK